MIILRTLLYTLFISLFAVAAQAQVKKDTIPAPVKDSTQKSPSNAGLKIRQATTFKAQAAKDTTSPKAKSAKDSAALKAKPAPAKIVDSTYLSNAGIRIGLDISRFALLYFQPYRTDVTVQADVRLGQKIYGAIETGWNRTSHNTDTTYSYKGSGIYSTIGIDYDFMKKKETTEQNMLYGGIRYGIARNTYEIPFYTIKNDYWDANTKGSYPKTTITSHWIELVFGLRVEAAKNLFLGWGVREKIMLSSGADDSHPPIVIPGYGSGTKRSQFDMTYTVSYMIPLYKVKVHVPPDKKK
ncbi:DUF6048 family protein [Chitinophaga silvisoli]|uniref:DUF6048 family protein n=1 Tax=Chitinophaga silvisoli TaxID=2291814 RepID=UPI0011C19421|nr:DUF6048 family protein [Chitinophaga silvisoli]